MHTRIAIVGSGYSGLGMAIRLKQEGRTRRFEPGGYRLEAA
jgi:cation diffusion facilitator CzcD-associated flavoprotein CzcO